jgi:hypothetical protein
MDHKHVHATVEIVDKSGKVVEKAESAGKVAKVISASHAFRQYDWLNKVPVTNARGDLRGMVLSSKWRGAYNFTVKYGATLEKYHVGTFATVAVALADSFEEVHEIWESNEPLDVKGAKLSTQATAIAMNCLTGIVTAPTHAVLTSLQGYCYMMDMAKNQSLGTCGQTLKNADLAIQSAPKQVSDGKNIYLFVNTTINPRVSKMLGF